MARLSNRLKKICKRKSQQRLKNSKSRIKRIKRGGGELERETEQLLINLEVIREEAHDFDDLSSLSTGQLMAKARELRKASDGVVSVNETVEYGKKQILHSLKQISKYTDDLIKELLEYDPNSISTFLMENRLIDHIDLNVIRDYLPSSMWHLFGGVSNFINWLITQIGINTFPESDKPPITKDTLLYIFKKLSDKYPTINMTDTNIRVLVLKDLFKKMYYLNEPNSITQLQYAGSPILENRICHKMWSNISSVAKQGVILLGKVVFKLVVFGLAAWIVLIAVVCLNLRNLPERCIRL